MIKEKTIAVEAALAAGELIKQRLNKRKNIRFKGAINIVTDVDEKAEALIVKKIQRAFPGHGILAEESPPLNKGSHKWIIDPLDGTTNYAHGFPFFAVSIALEIEGQVVLGVVYDPLRRELFRAQKGGGAFLNSKRIKVSGVRNLAKSFLATGFAYNFKHAKNNNLEYFRRFMLASLAVRRAGAATLDLCYVACGRFDGFWELDLKPWDTAAAALIVTEAGGSVSNAQGSPHDNYGKSLVASNGLIHKKMLKIMDR